MIFITIMVAITGCNTTDSPVPKLTIGIALPDGIRWLTDGDAMKTYAEAKGYNVELVYGSANSTTQTTQTQSEQIQGLLDKGVALLIIAPIDSSGITTVVAEAAAKDVPVIAYDRLITGTGDYESYITFDNYKIGQIQGNA